MVIVFFMGILVEKNHAYLLAAIGIGILMAVLFLKEKKQKNRTIWFILYGFIFLYGLFCSKKEQEFIDNYSTILVSNESVMIQGKVKKKEYKNERYQYYLDDCYVKARNQIAPCNQIIVPLNHDKVSIGKILLVEGEIKLFRISENEGNFDEKTFYQSQKIAFQIKNPNIINEYGKGNPLKEFLYQFQKRLKIVYTKSMPLQEGGILIRMLLGEQEYLDDEVKELFQKTGIAHILAISGLHISVIGMGLYKVLRKIFGYFLIPATIAAVIVALYGTMCGTGSSTMRAMIMFFLILLADISGRTYDSLSALSLSAILLLKNNTNIIYYSGFWFSYAAVLGVVLVFPVIHNATRKATKWNNLLDSGIAIQFMTIPLTAFYFYEIPVYAMLMNFIVLPFMSVLLFLGILGGMVGLIWMNAARWILMPCNLILRFYTFISEYIYHIKNATYITGKPAFEKILLYYGLLFLVLWIVKRRKKRSGFCFIGLLLFVFLFYSPNHGMELSFLSVGQGDGIYLKTASGHHLFIDGGSMDIKGVGTYRILPFLKSNGVRNIDYWFITHTDEDHVSGLKEILISDYPINHIVFSEYVKKDENYHTLVHLAKSHNINIIYMKYLDCFHFGNAKLTCIFPDKAYETKDKNSLSLSLLYEEDGFRALMTGDIGEKEEHAILLKQKQWLDNKSIDVYKAAHHGSKYSNGEELLSCIDFEITIVSCAKKNFYGHPHEEAVNRMSQNGSTLFYTMKSGQITIRKKNQKIIVQEYLKNDRIIK